MNEIAVHVDGEPSSDRLAPLLLWRVPKRADFRRAVPARGKYRGLLLPISKAYFPPRRSGSPSRRLFSALVSPFFGTRLYLGTLCWKIATDRLSKAGCSYGYSRSQQSQERANLPRPRRSLMSVISDDVGFLSRCCVLKFDEKSVLLDRPGSCSFRVRDSFELFDD